VGKIAIPIGLLLLLVGSAFAQPLAVRKIGSCPAGYFSGALYCAPMPGTARTAIPKVRSCPPNWSESGSYCLSPERRKR
jgi:hypothetical protein